MRTEAVKMPCKKYLLLLATFFFALTISAQKDTVERTPRDTLAVYKKIKKIAYKHKATKLLYHAIFVDPAPRAYEKKPLSTQQQRADPNLEFKGKIIRNVDIEVLDPFGYSVNDTTWQAADNSLQKAGNKYHVTTRKKIIRNLLLFKPNESLDVIKISESERLVRGIGYVADARIYIQKVGPANSDSVDVKVVVQDKWSFDVPIQGGLKGGSITLRDRNIVGSGQRAEQLISYKTNGDYQLTGSHTIANISNTFISSNVGYTKTKDVVQVGVSFSRPFYSGLAKWAGGAAAGQTWATYKYADAIENTEKSSALNYYNSDFWVARHINIKTGKNVNRRLSNVVAAVRYAETRYELRPSFEIDTNKVNTNTSLYLGSVGFSLSKFYKDQYIFRFGANEDIPEGLIVQFLYGVFYKEQSTATYYAGVDVSRGKHVNKIGYFSVSATYGSYFTKTTNSSTLNLGFTYFTDLLKSKRWYFRQFVYWKYINGFNKSPLERITLRPDELYGFRNGSMLGTSKMLLNLEGVIYTPYNIIGFRFAPLVLIGFGALTNADSKMFAGPIYPSYALGMLFRNENLLTSSFQLSFGFYPNNPDGTGQYTRFNPVTSFSVKFRSFAVSKPDVVSYN